APGGRHARTAKIRAGPGAVTAKYVATARTDNGGGDVAALASDNGCRGAIRRRTAGGVLLEDEDGFPHWCRRSGRREAEVVGLAGGTARLAGDCGVVAVGVGDRDLGGD